MRTLAREIDGLELPAVEKISESQQRGSVSDPDLDAALGAHAGRDDARGVDAAVREGAARRQAMARLTVKQIEKLIYPVSFYRNKAVFVKAHGEAIVDEVRRPGAATLEELVTLPGVGRKTANLVMILAFKSRREHLRRHSRAPHLEPARLGADADAGRDRAGALRGDRAAVVAARQSVSRDLGPERLPAGVSSLRRLRDRCRLPAIDVAESAEKTSVDDAVDAVAAWPCQRSPSSPAAQPPALGAVLAHAARRSPGAGPSIVVVETEKGTFEFETYPNEAPKTVAHIVELVNKRLLQRPARAPRRAGLRDAVRRSADARHDQGEDVGPRRSGTPVGVAEILEAAHARRRARSRMAHAGDAVEGRQPDVRRRSADTPRSTASTSCSAR